MSFALLLAATFLVSYAAISAEAKSYVLLSCIYAPIFPVAFAVPSTFAFDSIKGPQIQGLADYIYSLGIDTEATISAFEDGVSIVTERAYARTKAFQWFMTTVWALFLYGANQFNSFALNIAPKQISEIIADDISAFILYGIVSVPNIIVIIGYKKGNDAIFRRVQFAIQELKFRVANNQTNLVQPGVAAGTLHAVRL
ncbi:hypothetical protein [Methylocaldum sp.]|uniref:hypothetical protein n=1 Tax=Methylocaldum sp. TaxID=1969727 RepID=UPI002D58E44C|nr:hypothetical protein [Methylocaldum sp.]HYE36761.1 hypothetical protein [Methylocaldum sp.]